MLPRVEWERKGRKVYKAAKKVIADHFSLLFFDIKRTVCSIALISFVNSRRYINLLSTWFSTFDLSSISASEEGKLSRFDFLFCQDLCFCMYCFSEWIESVVLFV